MREEEREALAAYSISCCNVFPLTSRCNLRCLFCSHAGNPPQFKIPFLPDRAKHQWEAAMDLLDPGRKIVIGESATRIPEGEPFLHPELFSVLAALRRRFPRTLIQVTTNGTCLKGRAAQLLELNPLELVVSLNTADPLLRQRLLGDNDPERVLQGVKELGEKGVSFHGSVVFLPHHMGWEDLKKTISFLESCGARTVRVVMPGISRRAAKRLGGEAEKFPSLAEWHYFASRLEEERQRYSLPVLCEPPAWLVGGKEEECLFPRIAGVIAGSPAAEAGVKPGEYIQAVEGEKVFSRADAFQRILKAASPRVLLGSEPREPEPMGPEFLEPEGRSKVCSGLNSRGSRTLELREAVICKAAGQASGLAMDYDFDWRQALRLQRVLQRGPSLLLTSVLGSKVLQAAVKKLGGDSSGCFFHVAKNRFLGGNIGCAGLLTVSDLEAACREFKKDRPEAKISQVVIPEIAFDPWGRDLTGTGFWELEEAAGVSVVAV